jgi:hypothetical protein
MLRAAMNLVLKLTITAFTLAAMGILPQMTYRAGQLALKAHQEQNAFSLGKFNRMLLDGGSSKERERAKDARGQ